MFDKMSLLLEMPNPEDFLMVCCFLLPVLLLHAMLLAD